MAWPFRSQSDAYMVTESLNENQTLVRWGFSGRMNYPMNLFLLIMDMDESIGAVTWLIWIIFCWRA